MSKLSGAQRRKRRKLRGGKKMSHNGRPTAVARFAVQHKEQLSQGPPRRIQATDYNAVVEDLRCGAHIPDENGNLDVIYLKRTRTKKSASGPVGSTYGVRIIRSPKCNEPALTSKTIDGVRHHRCARHSFSDE